MRRDMEVIRELLLKIADGVELLEYDPMDKQENSYIYHVELLEQAGLIIYDKCFHDMIPRVYVDRPRLTWEGNNYLDAISNKTIWNDIKGIIKSKGLTLTDVPFEIIKEISVKLLKTKINI